MTNKPQVKIQQFLNHYIIMFQKAQVQWLLRCQISTQQSALHTFRPHQFKYNLDNHGAPLKTFFYMKPLNTESYYSIAQRRLFEVTMPHSHHGCRPIRA